MKPKTRSASLGQSPIHWNVDTAETAVDGAERPAMPLTTQQMQDVASFAGWDFASTWQLLPGQFPTLR